jgi:hypothetical protein
VGHRHRIAVTRARCHPETRAYIDRKRAEGKSTREAIRCLKRHLARRIWHLLGPHPDLDIPTHQFLDIGAASAVVEGARRALLLVARSDSPVGTELVVAFRRRRQVGSECVAGRPERRVAWKQHSRTRRHLARMRGAGREAITCRRATCSSCGIGVSCRVSDDRNGRTRAHLDASPLTPASVLASQSLQAFRRGVACVGTERSCLGSGGHGRIKRQPPWVISGVGRG